MCLVVAGEDEVEFVSEKKFPKCHMSEQPSRPRKKRVEIAFKEAVCRQSFESSTAFVDGLEDQIGVNMIKAGPPVIMKGKFTKGTETQKFKCGYCYECDCPWVMRFVRHNRFDENGVEDVDAPDQCSVLIGDLEHNNHTSSYRTRGLPKAVLALLTPLKLTHMRRKQLIKMIFDMGKWDMSLEFQVSS